MSASTIIPVASHVIEPASFYRRWWLILLAAAIAVWLALSVSLIINDTFSSTAWLVLGSVQAIAFSFAGVLFGIDVQRERDGGAERRAAAAEKMAIDFRDDAMRGRALAAVLQAEDVSAETLSQETVAVLKRNRYLAINLFGELVRNGQKGPAAEAESIPIGPLTP
ncbi:hypothetical protein [Kribbella sp. NPDC049227]|uniref:hypothetical protein n=1 Tax=Kribbella sp. NPDC049227 TaxID=3364113 RepID=UPI0037107184